MTFSYETKKLANGVKVVIGCDEVGRGCLAGPVVAAAVAITNIPSNAKLFSEVKDSKALSPKKREELNEVIKRNFNWAVASVSHEAIDAINIHNASLLAMRKAVGRINLLFGSAILTQDLSSEFVFVDGKFSIPNLGTAQEAVVDGDAKVFCIAAASIIAKVHRDGLMRKLSNRYPAYGFERHKGYATLEHRKAVTLQGLCSIHRKSFCRQYLK